MAEFGEREDKPVEKSFSSLAYPPARQCHKGNFLTPILEAKTLFFNTQWEKTLNPKMKGGKNMVWKSENGPAVGRILKCILTEILQLVGVCFWFVQFRVLSAVTGNNGMLRHMRAERAKKRAHTIGMLNIYYLIWERNKLVGWNEKTRKKSKVISAFRKRNIP